MSIAANVLRAFLVATALLVFLTAVVSRADEQDGDLEGAGDDLYWYAVTNEYFPDVMFDREAKRAPGTKDWVLRA